ncbi:MAG TPA: sulfopyruvate decarboxylase subunit beta [Nitrospirota bacterium]|nr:sulfopyruvate decarboxylase subunit beta [Nitrospirota bacterium]
MPRPEEDLITLLKKHRIDFTASLPCEKIKTLLEMVGRDFPHLPLTREEEGVGICAGAALAGKRPAVFVQSSGIGNMINALLSLTGFYQLPLALFVSRRGIYKEKIEAQMPMGERLPSILAGSGIMYSKINSKNDIGTIDRELQEIFNRNTIHAFLMSPQVWEGSECGMQNVDAEKRGRGDADLQSISSPCPPVTPPPRLPLPRATLTRYDIIRIIAPYLEDKAVVCNLGWPSKELYSLKHQPSNFYMLGSMGMATPVGLGIALTSSKEIVVIDGDGSLLMNPGTLATAASVAPKNLTIIAIDNGAYGSTGNQPTLASSCVDLEQVARGFGFRETVKVSTEKEIIGRMKQQRQGPSFIHVLAIPGNRDVPNIPVHHLEIKKQVEEFLKK